MAINELYHFDGWNKSILLEESTGHLLLKKRLRVYNLAVFEYLKRNPSAHIPKIRKMYMEGECLVLIEDYVNGLRLDDYLRSESPPAWEIRRLLLSICDALSFLHSANPPIIHRDIKASNILVTDDAIVKIIDYDAARVYIQGQDRDTVLIGTEGSAAPEQYGFGQSDARTDVYAFGILLRDLFPGMYTELVQKATKLDPAMRYQSIEEMRAAISAASPPGSAFPRVSIQGAPHALQQAGSGIAATRPDAAWNGHAQASSRLVSSGGERSPAPPARFRIPGFRSGVLWKKLLALSGYAILACTVLSIRFESAHSEAGQWIIRSFTLLVFASWIDIAFDCSPFARSLPYPHAMHRVWKWLLKLVYAFLSMILLLCIAAAMQEVAGT